MVVASRRSTSTGAELCRAPSLDQAKESSSVRIMMTAVAVRALVEVVSGSAMRRTMVARVERAAKAQAREAGVRGAGTKAGAVKIGTKEEVPHGDGRAGGEVRRPG